MPSEPGPPRRVTFPPMPPGFEQGRLPILVTRLQAKDTGRAGGSAVHAYAVIMLVTRGESRIRHAGDLVLRAGDVHLIPPGDAHVAGIVRQETGRTVGEWILECRMAEARRRLRGTDERVDIIAERVGYADVTHFIRLFRRVHGVTPAAWKRRMLTAGA